jgi:hypothetical protein
MKRIFRSIWWIPVLALVLFALGYSQGYQDSNLRLRKTIREYTITCEILEARHASLMAYMDYNSDMSRLENEYHDQMQQSNWQMQQELDSLRNLPKTIYIIREAK